MKIGLGDKIKKLLKRKKSKGNDKITVSSEIKIVSIGEIKSLANNSLQNKPIDLSSKKENREIYVPLDRPMIVTLSKIRGMKPEPHHSRKLWVHRKGPIEPEERPIEPEKN